MPTTPYAPAPRPTPPSAAGTLPRASRVRIRATGTDLDLARTELPPIYQGTHWRAETTAGPFSYGYAASGDATMSLRTSRMQGSLVGDIPPGDDLVVQWIAAGRATVDVGHRAVQLSRGLPVVFPADRSFVFAFEDYDQRLVHLSKAGVASVAAEQGRVVAGPLRFDHTAVPSAASVRSWHAAVQHVTRTLSSGPVSPVLWSELTRLTTVALLDMVQPEGEPLPPQLLHPRHATLRRAVEHVHEHAHEPLTVGDIAASAGLGIRATQVMFQDVLERTPMTYLREVRLDRVHEVLRRAEPDSATVSALAREWGFGHAGRFSAAYAERFGEYPSETLRR